MDNPSNNTPILAGGPPPVPTPDREANDVSAFTPDERDILELVEKEGVRAIGATVAQQMYNLFLEGYTCSEIAKMNSQLKIREGDVLYLRKRYRWDHFRSEYIFNLQNQSGQRLAKGKLEMLEFMMNQFAVAHKEFNEKAKKYIQTGKEEDKPDHWLNTPTAYKTMIDAISKVTGEDRVTNHNIRSESKVTVESNAPVTILSDALQSQLLRKLSENK